MREVLRDDSTIIIIKACVDVCNLTHMPPLFFSRLLVDYLGVHGCKQNHHRSFA